MFPLLPYYAFPCELPSLSTASVHLPEKHLTCQQGSLLQFTVYKNPNTET